MALLFFLQKNNTSEDSEEGDGDLNISKSDKTETVVRMEEAPRQNMFIFPKRTLASPVEKVMPVAKKKLVEDSRIEHAYSILKDCLSKKTSRDKNNVFAEYVALKLKGYSNQTRNIVEHQISNILFEADMGHFDRESDMQS